MTSTGDTAGMSCIRRANRREHRNPVTITPASSTKSIVSHTGEPAPVGFGQCMDHTCKQNRGGIQALQRCAR